MATAILGQDLLSPEFLTQLERLALVSRRAFRGRTRGDRKSPTLQGPALAALSHPTMSRLNVLSGTRLRTPRIPLTAAPSALRLTSAAGGSLLRDNFQPGRAPLYQQYSGSDEDAAH